MERTALALDESYGSMKPRLVPRVASLFALLAVLLAQLWAGPASRLEAKACCCKPGAVTQQSISRVRCCAQPESPRAVPHALARFEQHDDAPFLVAVAADVDPVSHPPATDSPHTSRYRSPGLGSDSGLPYRLRI